MPIETAPKDGTHVLCCDDDGAIFRGAYNDEDEGFWSAMCGQPVVYPPEPTHWRPLPHPPGEPEATSLSVSSSSGDGA